MPIIHMLNADRVPNCDHGMPQDDFCRECLSDDVFTMHMAGKSVREIVASLGWSETMVRRLLRERGIVPVTNQS